MPQERVVCGVELQVFFVEFERVTDDKHEVDHVRSGGVVLLLKYT